MTSKRYTFFSAVHLILIKECRVLLLRRFNTGYEDGKYSVPAGHIDQGERAKTAMVREVKEEAGLDISEDALETVHVMHRKGDDKERIDFFMSAKEWTGEPQICEEDKCDELSWYKLNELPENIIPYVKSALERIRRNDFYSEFGWDNDTISSSH
ncbi:NUDIX domain-containing protein [Patescibacteria group bacterium]|nr:NUDIX domain-containing protein [Patescibacteria group bacterium]